MRQPRAGGAIDAVTCPQLAQRVAVAQHAPPRQDEEGLVLELMGVEGTRRVSRSDSIEAYAEARAARREAFDTAAKVLVAVVGRLFRVVGVQDMGSRVAHAGSIRARQGA